MTPKKEENGHYYLHQAAARRAAHSEAVLQGMKYIDLHCDALTSEGVLQVTGEKLHRGGCLLQCFAAYVSAREGRYASALALCDRFDEMCEGEGYHVVRRALDIAEGAVNAMLTVEEGGAIEGDLIKLKTLYSRGVRMMTLTWNYPNEIGYPNFPDYEGLKTGRVPFAVRETERGLTPFGFEAAACMQELGIMIDVSHGSDRLFFDVAHLSKTSGIPFVASHSGADAVHAISRNLTDEQIKTLADCGGVVGLDFCADFLSSDTGEEGQKRAILAHAKHILDMGGEDVLALGSDFDGIPENAYMKDAARMPELLLEFERMFGARITEKIVRKNAERVLLDVLK